MLPAHPPFLEGGETTASPCRVGMAWTVVSATEEGSDVNVDRLLAAVAGRGRHPECSVGRGGPPVGGQLHGWVSCVRWKMLQESCLCEPDVQELTWHYKDSIPRWVGFLQA